MTMDVILGKKIGMAQMFEDNGDVIPVTLIDVSNVKVTKLIKSGEKQTHVELGKDKKVKNVDNSIKGQYKEFDFVPKFKKVFKTSDEITVNTEIDLSAFEKNDKVSVSGVTKGKGFRSVIQRWGFAGGPATHGASDRERAPGSLGTRTIPGRVFKGKKMAGHTGVRNKTIKNLKVAYIDSENNILAIKGAIPGTKDSYVIVKKESKK